uniref:HNH endonuclease n=1 Tax=Marseillevirus LCMAC101 TaxID=2506602 RepID=A0A481YT57_9VIRU|nr:MAG: HNH endonuclease [Marseillevirus LCMAC101]
MTDEEWKDFPIVDGRKFSNYEVSSLGQRRNKKSSHVFSDRPKRSGYVCNEFLDDKGKSKTMRAHVIVARAFIGDPESDDLTVDHINREPADNRVVNLRWATRKQQTANSDQSKCKPTGQPVIQYTMDMVEIKRWPNIITASKELGIDKSSIGRTCRGKRGHVGGYKWTYERQDLDGEVWKNYEPNGVQVSNMGRIKPSCSHIVYGSERNGYLVYGNPVKYVHIIIAETFLPNPKKKPEVNHKDKNGTNNKVENLEWVTKSEQMIHSHQTNSNPDRYSTARAVKQYDLEENFIGEYRSIKKAARDTECSETSISYVCSGLLKSTNGYVFEYVNKDVLNRSLRSSNKVNLINEKGNVVETYETARAAALDLGIAYYSIYSVLGGVTKKTKDSYRFRYH